MGHRAKSNCPKDCRYVGKGGLKLEFAISHFQLLTANKIAADFGSHQGGFVDCLLQHGVSKVYSIDTSYGTLDWKLRNDPRVVVCERTNAMHWVAPEALDLITIDVGWTRQQHILPSAVRSLHNHGCILSLLKPQYERPQAQQHVLSETEVAQVLAELLPWLSSQFHKVEYTWSPYPGSGGNQEAWLYLTEKVNS